MDNRFTGRVFETLDQLDEPCCSVGTPLQFFFQNTPFGST